jgi:LmbE family N-acetylglucosaminyl deacetylase
MEGLNPFFGRRVLLLAAHPDDETIGCGGQLGKMTSLTLVYLTDGVPSLWEAWKHGCATMSRYQHLRRTELRNALSSRATMLYFLGYPDQKACFHLAASVRRLTELLTSIKPEILLTHAYEGGHPDHDTAAAVAAFAVRRSATVAQAWEMAGYNGPAGREIWGEFLAPGPEVLTMHLSPSETVEKTRAIACYRSQGRFPSLCLEAESFRRAPCYDFGLRPHHGALLYEGKSWGMDWELWSSLVREEQSHDVQPETARGFPGGVEGVGTRGGPTDHRKVFTGFRG